MDSHCRLFFDGDEFINRFLPVLHSLPWWWRQQPRLKPSVNNRAAQQHNILDDSNPHTHRRENLKYHQINFFLLPSTKIRKAKAARRNEKAAKPWLSSPTTVGTQSYWAQEADYETLRWHCFFTETGINNEFAHGFEWNICGVFNEMVFVLS
jgi:hypothetical protein